MRFMHKYTPQYDAARTVRRFLWWPTTLPQEYGAPRETRWLEMANVRQRFCRYGWDDKAWAMTSAGLHGDWEDTEERPWWQRLWFRGS